MYSTSLFKSNNRIILKTLLTFIAKLKKVKFAMVWKTIYFDNINQKLSFAFLNCQTILHWNWLTCETGSRFDKLQIHLL